MIARIEALNYRCLRDVSQELGRLNVLIGANGSGKSSFLDVLLLLRDFLNRGVQEAILIPADPSAIGGRCRRLEELFFRGQGDRFEVAVELIIPDDLRRQPGDRARYEVAFGRGETGELVLFNENFGIVAGPRTQDVQKKRQSLLSAWRGSQGVIGFVVRDRSGLAEYNAELESWKLAIRIAQGRPALASVPEDPDRFPVTRWVRDVLTNHVRYLALNPVAMRRPCSPSIANAISADGSNLPRVLQDLKAKHLERFEHWVTHVRSILPDVKTVDIVERPEDRHLYLRLHPTSGEPLASWLLSDGTLRMLALTVLPYLPDRDNIYLVEEPENGVHPQAVESIYQAFSAVEGSQVVLATHSPLFLSCAKLDEITCFARDEEGATLIRRGNEHPRLRDWRGELDLPTLYAAGVFS